MIFVLYTNIMNENESKIPLFSGQIIIGSGTINLIRKEVIG